MLKYLRFITCFVFISILFQGFSQQNSKAKIAGTIVDAQSGAVLSFSSIRIMSEADNKLVAGNIADENGKFSVSMSYGSYYALIEFVGYKPFKTDIFKITKENPELNLGSIKVISSSQNLNEVEIRAEKSSMELALDKKVFNVGKEPMQVVLRQIF